MPAVVLSFTALPAHVRTARLVALATARRAGVAEELLDEVRFAVGEACSRAVAINAPAGRPVVVTMTDEQDRFTVEVQDEGHPADGDSQIVPDVDVAALSAPQWAALGSNGTDEGDDPLPDDFGLAVISGLVEQVAVTAGLDGTRVTLTWPATDVMAPAAE